MSILSHAEYLNHWTAPAPNGFGQTICPPCYHEYLQREIYFNDYLDLFRNEKTFEREDFEGYEDKFYVKITNCPILGVLDIPKHELYTINIDGIEYLLVDYDYPWTDEELDEKRYIKYILIGEAAPQQNVISINECGGDNNNTYFYNITHVGTIVMKNGREYRNPTPWLNAPRLNWNCPPFQNCPNDKAKTLLCLATKGVLLIDLFPFAISYTKLRGVLNINGVTNFYWYEPINFYSLSNRINDIDYLLSNNWDLSLITPCVISGYIINPANGFNPLEVMPIGLHPAQFRTLHPDPSRCPLGGHFRKVAVSSAGAPTQNLINISF